MLGKNVFGLKCPQNCTFFEVFPDHEQWTCYEIQPIYEMQICHVSFTIF